jgi:hypothetical protein
MTPTQLVSRKQVKRKLHVMLIPFTLRYSHKLILYLVVRDTTSGLRAKMVQVVRCTQVENTFLVVANRAHSPHPENWPASFSLRPACDN